MSEKGEMIKRLRLAAAKQARLNDLNKELAQSNDDMKKEELRKRIKAVEDLTIGDLVK